MASAPIRIGISCWRSTTVLCHSSTVQLSVKTSLSECRRYLLFRNHSVIALYSRASFSAYSFPNPRSWQVLYKSSLRRPYATELKRRSGSSGNRPTDSQKKRIQTTLNYLISLTVLVLGMSYAAVPMYRIFCQVTGIGGSSNLAKHGGDKVESMKKVNDQKLTIKFNADTASHLHWHFKPLQREVVVFPGETALAFYTATNPTDRPVTGISTYTVLPFEAAKYLNKIQCFCFEEQRLNPHEQVDMPVFFYIDPEFVNDPWLQKTETITLSYTFFEAKEASKIFSSLQPHSWTSAGKPQPAV